MLCCWFRFTLITESCETNISLENHPVTRFLIVVYVIFNIHNKILLAALIGSFVPVRLLSSICNWLQWNSRTSAGTRSPICRSTTSPGTRFRAAICSTWPSRKTAQVCATSFDNSSNDFSDLKRIQSEKNTFFRCRWLIQICKKVFYIKYEYKKHLNFLSKT